MIRVLLLPNEPLINESEVVFELPHTMVGAFALELCLLIEGMAERLRIHANSATTIVLMVARGTVLGRAVAHREQVQASFTLGQNQAEYLLATLLRAHRDGAAEVNHIHIEASDRTEQFDLTVMFELYKEPMTASEALKLLE